MDEDEARYYIVMRDKARLLDRMPADADGTAWVAWVVGGAMLAALGLTIGAVAYWVLS